MTASISFSHKVLNHFFRGIPVEAPEKIWVSLHDGLPNSPATEIQTSQWPSYVRLDVNLGEPGIEGAFKVPGNYGGGISGKETVNAKQLLWPPFNGTGTITIKGIALWAVSTGGNPLIFGNLASPKTLSPSDEIVIHIDGLKIQAV